MSLMSSRALRANDVGERSLTGLTILLMTARLRGSRCYSDAGIELHIQSILYRTAF